MKRNPYSQIGKQYGHWLVVYPIHGQRGIPMKYRCQCKCGAESTVSGANLRSGSSTKCSRCYHNSHRLRPFEAAFNRYKRISPHPFHLSYREFLSLTKNPNCFYCGAPLYWQPFPATNERNGHNLDRIDNTKGYTIDNVVCCCGSCNFTRADRFSSKEFELIGDTIRFIRELRSPTVLADQPYIHTSSGEIFFPAQPTLSQIKIEDIATALSQLCRFNGHTKKFYSVAEHVCRVHDITKKSERLWALLHDAPEALSCADIPRPLKYSPGMRIYREYEHRIMRAVAQKFGLPLQEPNCVKRADNILLITEQRDLMKHKKGDAGNVKKETLVGLHPLRGKINPWSPQKAKREFLKRFFNLTRNRV